MAAIAAAGACGGASSAEPTLRGEAPAEDPASHRATDPPTQGTSPSDSTSKLVASGTLRFGPTAKAGTSVFLIVKRADAKGDPVGPPLAVDKLTYAGADLPFVLDSSNAMTPDADLGGDLVVTARYDQDGDALSKEPGDLTGKVRVKAPATKVLLVIDTVVK
jgi:hypothetical protein